MGSSGSSVVAASAQCNNSATHFNVDTLDPEAEYSFDTKTVEGFGGAPRLVTKENT